MTDHSVFGARQMFLTRSTMVKGASCLRHERLCHVRFGGDHHTPAGGRRFRSVTLQRLYILDDGPYLILGQFGLEGGHRMPPVPDLVEQYAVRILRNNRWVGEVCRGIVRVRLRAVAPPFRSVALAAARHEDGLAAF